AEINNWLEFEYPFANTDMATSNLAFRWENGDGSSALIDDIFVDYAASCPRPLRVEIDSVSANSAKISWEERGVATSWEVEYLPIGGSVGSGNKVWATTAPTAVITDLDALTNYEVYIRAICAGGDTSEYSTAISFVTLQSVATLPYLCDFEDDTENALWDLENGNQINKWYIDTIVHNQIVESKGLYISDDGGATNHFFQTRNSSTWAFRDIQLPEEADGEFVLSFDWRAFGYTDHMFGTHQDYLSVYIGPIATVESGNTQAPAGSTTLFNALNESDQWVRGETVIPLTFGGEMVRLYFLWRNSGSSFGQQPPAAVDNISIFHTTCIPPTSIQVNAENITDSSAVITWTRDENNSWILEYKNVDSVQWSSIQVDTDTTYLANQLTDGATYEVRVKTVCSDDNSRYISTTFETPEAPEIPELCIEPTNLAVTIITQNSAHIAWTAGGKETSWKLSYKAETGDTYTDSTLTTTTFDLENLAPATTYEVLVWAICAEGEQSDSVFATFTTENEPVILYNITATAGSNGRIEPSGTFTVEAGSDTMFVITPDKDYIIESIVINSAGAPIQDTIRLENINEDYTIQVEFVTNSISKHNTHDITIYPNPAKDLLNVKLDRQFDNVVVYNLLGEKVAYQTITDMNITIRVASFAPGIYFARFQNSKETVNIKFVKE
ncbi:fibronectin type III domain-containing protein, partial [Bacteroidales bacterium OttesenSCG-928-A14]|nr:fibronectin type III domain-containing protein [Bacteroidales bacterium OttesenSCG-928-A14]